MAACGMKFIDVGSESIEIFGTFFSYNDILRNLEKNFQYNCWYARILKLWRTRNLKLEGEIVFFESLMLCKIVFHFHLSKVPNEVALKLQSIEKIFLWKTSNPKIKHKMLCKNYTDGFLRNVDIPKKVISLQCSWIKRFCNGSFHELKPIPLHLINQ